MSDSPLFKRAFVRGLNAELMRQGVVHFPSKEAADHAADYVADNFCPDPVKQGQDITLKVAHTLCQQLDVAGKHFCKEAGNRYQPSLNKTAAQHDPTELALHEAWQAMEKVAAETGSIYEGGDAQNDMPAGASHSGESALEEKRRPENYANLGEDGVGDLERKGQGSVGTEEKHPEKPKATDSESNSVQEYSKSGSASLANIVKKVAAIGSLMDPGKDKNDMPAAAAVQGEAAQEQARRGEGYAHKGESGVGRSDMVPSAKDQVGTERAHPEAPPAAMHADKQNVPKEHVKSAFDQLFELTARDIHGYLPGDMEDGKKIAHIRANMGLETEKRAEYLHTMWTHLSPENADAVRDHYLKTASVRLKQAMEGMEIEISPGKEDEGEEEKEESAESSSEEKKEKSLPPALMDKMEKKEEEKEASARPSSRNALSALHQKLASLQSS